MLHSVWHSAGGFPGSSADKESTCNAGDPGLIPGSGRSPGEGIGYPLQYSWASLVAQSVNNSPAMWETFSIPELGRSHGEVGKLPWRKEWLSNPVFWAGEFHGQRSLAGYSPWDYKESETTEWLSLSLYFQAGWQYTALTHSFPNFDPVHCSMSGSNCCFLTCIQVSQEAGKVVWYPCYGC